MNHDLRDWNERYQRFLIAFRAYRINGLSDPAGIRGWEHAPHIPEEVRNLLQAARELYESDYDSRAVLKVLPRINLSIDVEALLNKMPAEWRGNLEYEEAFLSGCVQSVMNAYVHSRAGYHQ